MPPERALTNQVLNTKLDVFSFGRVIFFVVAGTLPHRNMIESAHVSFCSLLFVFTVSLNTRAFQGMASRALHPVILQLRISGIIQICL